MIGQTRFTVASAIRDSLLITGTKSYGGAPDEIWVDNGKELLSKHVEYLCKELGILLQPNPPHQPQLKGIVERFFQTLNTRLWATLPLAMSDGIREHEIRTPKRS